MKKEYEFRYRLDDHVVDTQIDNLEDFYREQVKALQEVVEFTYQGKIVDIDGIKFIRDDRIIALRPIEK